MWDSQGALYVLCVASTFTAAGTPSTILAGCVGVWYLAFSAPKARMDIGQGRTRSSANLCQKHFWPVGLKGRGREVPRRRTWISTPDAGRRPLPRGRTSCCRGQCRAEKQARRCGPRFLRHCQRRVPQHRLRRKVRRVTSTDRGPCATA